MYNSTNSDFSGSTGGGTAGGGGGGDYLMPIIQIIAETANEAANRATTKSENKKAREFARSESELAYQRDQEMWHMQNAYNSPQAQMERLKAAGLNPNLVYGASAPGNQSGSAPTYTPAEGKFGLPRFQLPDLLSMYQTFQMRNAQIDQVKAGTEQTEAATDNIRMRTAVDEYGLGYRKQVDPYQLDITKNKVESSNLEVRKTMQAIRNMNEQERNLVLEGLIKQGAIKKQDLEREIMEETRMSKETLNMLRKYGATESDPFLLRLFINMMEKSGINLGF